MSSPLARPRDVYANWVSPWSCFQQPLPSNLTVAPGSAAIVQTLTSQPGLANGGAGFSIGMNFMPLAVVPETAPEVSFGSGSSTGNLPNASAPIPTYAQSLVANTGDSPLLMVKPATGEIWELWQADYNSSTATWTCSNGGYVSNAKTAPGVIPDPYGLSASGLPYTGLIITQADIKRGFINHTVAIEVGWATYPPANTGWPPAVRFDSGDAGGPNAPAEGMWLTWAPGSIMPTGMTPIAQMLWQAIATYGCIVTDVTGSDPANDEGVYFLFEERADWTAEGGIGTDPISAHMNGLHEYEAIQYIPLQDLQVIVPPILGTGGSAPAAPAGVTATASYESATISWNAVAGTQFYLVEYRQTGTTSYACYTSWPTGTSVQVGSLTAGQSYDFRVWSVGAGSSTYSGTLSSPSAGATATPSSTPPAAITVASSAQYTSGSSTSGQIAFSWSAPTAGNLLLAFINWNSNNGRTIATVPSGWNLAFPSVSNYHGDAIAVYWKEAATTDTNPTWTLSNNTDWCSGELLELSNASVTSPINTYMSVTNDTGSSTSWAYGPLTPGVYGCMEVFAMTCNGAGVTPVAPSGWSTDQYASGTYHSGFVGNASAMTTSTSSAVSATWTFSQDFGTSVSLLIAPA